MSSIRINRLLFIFLFCLGCSARALEVRFVPEMARIPEDEWPACPPGKYADEMPNIGLVWVSHRDHFLAGITAARVRDLSRWAQAEMADYDIPAFRDLRFRADRVSLDGRYLLVESVLDTLPSHNPLVTRWLKFYLVYDVKRRGVTDAIVTIRGQVEE